MSDINAIKYRIKDIEGRMLRDSEECKAALEEARTEVNGRAPGLTGDILVRFERAESRTAVDQAELNKLQGELTAARSHSTIVGGSSRKVLTNRALGKDDKFADLHNDRSDQSEELGSFLKSVALRTQSVGTDSDGGFTVPTNLSTAMWDLARDKTVAKDAGVSFVPLEGPGDRFTLPKVTADAEPVWAVENAQIDQGMVQFGSNILEPGKLVLLVTASRELVQDSSHNIDRLIVDNVSEKFARVIDAAIFNGSGVGAEPTGIRNFPGIPQVAAVGTPNWTTLSDAALAIREKNYDPTAFVMAPSIDRALTDQRMDQGGGPNTGMYLPAPPSIEGISHQTTNMVPTDLGVDGDESFILAGDFSEAIAGIRLELNVLPLSERFAEFDQVGWVFTYRMDTTVMRTEAFQSIEGVTL